jgi:hypothetical protein
MSATSAVARTPAKLTSIIGWHDDEPHGVYGALSVLPRRGPRWRAAGPATTARPTTARHRQRRPRLSAPALRPRCHAARVHHAGAEADGMMATPPPGLRIAGAARFVRPCCSLFFVSLYPNETGFRADGHESA